MVWLSGGPHSTSFFVLQPQPVAPSWPFLPSFGLYPAKPSIVPAARLTWAPDDAVSPAANVASETANAFASVERFGMSLGSKCVTQRYGGLTHPPIRSHWFDMASC